MKFGKSSRKILAVLSAVVLLTGCGAATPQSTPQEDPSVSNSPAEETRKDVIVIKVANFFAETHPANQALNEVFKPMLEEKTNGRYIVEIYPNYVLGGESEITRAAIEGTIEIALSGVIMSDQFPKMKVMDFPWVFSDIDSSYAAINSPEAVAAIDSDVQSVGLRCRGFVLNGVRSISNNKHPIYSVEDCADIKIRVPEAAQFVDNAEALGFSCESMSIAEIYTALQQGVIDGQENPPTTLLTSGWYTEQDYLALTKHQITYNWLAVNSDFYNGMPQEDQAIFDECCRAYLDAEMVMYKEREETDIEMLRDMGIEVTEPDREQFHEIGLTVIEQYMQEYPEFKEMLEMLRALGAQ